MEPIAESVWFFRTFISTLDLSLFLTLPAPTAGVEAAVGMVNMACLAVVSYQYGKHHPHLGISLMTQMPRQAVVFIACLFLAYMSGSRRRSSASPTSWRSTALQWRRRAWMWGGPAPLLKSPMPEHGSSPASKLEQARPPACQAAVCEGGCNTASEGPVASAVARVSSSLAGAIATGATPDASDSALGAPPNSRAWLPAVDRTSCAKPVSGSACGSDTLPLLWPSAAQQVAAALPRSAAGDAPRRQPRYRSFVQRSAVFAKIPGCDPTQITPGFEARLAAALAATDTDAATGGRLRLAGVYVREGCIELLLEVAEWGFPSIQEDGIAKGFERTTASGEGGGEGSCPWVAAGGLSLDDIFATLQLHGNSAPKAGGGAAAGSGAAATAWTAAPGALGSLTVTPRLLLLPAARVATEVAGAGATDEDVQPAIARATLLVSGLAGRCRRPAAASEPATAAPQAVAAAAASAATAAAGAAAAAAPPAPSELEVLVRCRGAYLPVGVAWRRRGGDGPAAAELEEEEEEGTGGEAMEAVLELQQLPSTPGELVIDVRRRGLPWACAPLLLLTDPRVAAELAAPLAGWEGPGEGLDGLVRDLAAWEAHTWPAAAEAAEAASAAAFTAYGQPVAPQMLAALGRHLLEYATAVGWVHTAERIRAGLEQLQSAAGGRDAAAGLGILLERTATVSGQVLAAAGDAATVSGSGGAVLSDAAASRAGGWAVADAEVTRAAQASLPAAGGHRLGGDGGSAGKCSSGKVGVGLPDSRGKSAASGRRAASGDDRWGGWAQSLLLVLGLRRAPAAEETALRAYAQPWTFARGHAVRVIGTLSLLAVLLRCALDRRLPSGAPAVLLAGLGTGALSSAAKLLLPYPAWARLEARCRHLHYVGLMVAKGLIAFGGFPAPPGIQPYLWAPGMLA